MPTHKVWQHGTGRHFPVGRNILEQGDKGLDGLDERKQSDGRYPKVFVLAALRGIEHQRHKAYADAE
jgi:hypothetical protein